MRRYLRSYWFWFFVTVALISGLDYIDHYTRDESYFRDVWFRWLLFTLFNTLALCGWMYLFNILTIKAWRENLLQQLGVIVIALLLHQYVSGPVFNLLLFGDSGLRFKFNVTTLAIALVIFCVIRLIIFLVTRPRPEAGNKKCADVPN